MPKALAPLNVARPIKKMAIFDIETNEWIDDTFGMKPEDIQKDWHNKPLAPFLVMFYKDGVIKHFDGPDCMRKFLIAYLKHENRNYVCYAHNGGKFDFIALYETLVRDPYLSKRFFPKPFLAHGSIISLKIKDNHKHVWHFRDSYALLQGSLDSLCKSFNPAHVKLTRPKQSYNKAKKEWLVYCQNDCKALYDILQKFNQIIIDIGGSVGYTIASTAMLTFRKKFLHFPIPNYFSYNTMIRQAYYGGRVEIINMYARDTGRPYYYYDINSLYPWCMKKFKYPVSLPRSVAYKDADEVKDKCGIMECHVISPPDLDIPILPYRDEARGKLLFPLGEWNAWYEFSLIEKALKYGYDIKPKRIWEFDGEDIFSEYVDRIYMLKQNSEGAEKQTMKLLLNSLYGKFGEKHEREELITDPDEDITGSYPYDSVFGYSIRKFNRYSAYHLPAIASRVTSQAQIKLYSYIEYVQAHGGTIYYMDTDSLITDIRIPTSEELGDLKLECDFSSGIFLAPKTYYLNTYEKGGKIIMKGFSKSFKDHFGFKEFEEALLTGKKDQFQEWRIAPASLKKIRIRHLDGFCTLVEPRSIQEDYNKREVLPDFTTRPWVIKV